MEANKLHDAFELFSLLFTISSVTSENCCLMKSAYGFTSTVWLFSLADSMYTEARHYHQGFKMVHKHTLNQRNASSLFINHLFYSEDFILLLEMVV